MHVNRRQSLPIIYVLVSSTTDYKASHIHPQAKRMNKVCSKRRSPFQCDERPQSRPAIFFCTTKPNACYKLHKCGIDNPQRGCCVSWKQQQREQRYTDRMEERPLGVKILPQWIIVVISWVLLWNII